MPTTFDELGAKVEDIPEMAAKMGIEGTTGGFVHLTTEDVEKIYMIAAGGKV